MRAPRELKPRPLSISLARFSSAIAVCATMLAAARGATLYWDSDSLGGNNAASGAGLGGSGIWDDLVTSNWWNTGAADTTWSNAGLHTAVFAGAAGTVQLGAPITLQNLVINTSDYVITSGASALTFASNAIVNLSDRSGGAVNATISTQLAGNAGTGFTLNGNGGTLTLDYAGTHAVTGPINIRSGTLQVNGAVSTLDAATGVNFKGSGTFRLDNVGALAATNYNLGTLTNTGGDGVVHLERTEIQNMTLAFSSLAARHPGAVGVFEANGNAASLSTNAKISIAGVSTGVMPGYFAKSEGGFASLAYYDASGFVREVNYGTDPGTISISTTPLIAGFHNRLTGVRTAQASQTIQSLAMTANGSLSLAGGATLTVANGTVGTLLKVGGTSSTISGGTGITTGSGGELIVRVDTAADQLTISTPILGTTGALTKSGNGTLALSAANAFTGTTYVNGGTLRVEGTGALGAGTGLTLSGGTYLVLAGANTATSELVPTGKSAVTVNGAATISIDRLAANPSAANKTFTFGNLTIGNQVLTTSAVATYATEFTGTTTFTDSLPATFNVTGATESGTVRGLVLSGQVTGPSGFIKRGTGTLRLGNATNNFGGAGAVVELQEGVLSIASNGALGHLSNTLLLNAGETTDGLLTTATFATSRGVALGQALNNIEVASGTTLTLDGLVTSSITADLVKKGAGTLVLNNGANAFGGTDGMIDIQAGVLRVGTPGALGGTGNLLQLNGGSLAVPGSMTLPQDINLATASGTIDIGSPNTLTLSGKISSTGTAVTLAKSGTGNLILTNGGNSFGGVGSTLDIQGGGTLTVTSGGALGDPANTVKLSGNFVGDGTSEAPQSIKLAQAATASFDVTGANTFTLGGVVSNFSTAVNFTKTGTGTLELTNVNAFGGATKSINLDGGFLAASSDSSLGAVENKLRFSGGPTGGGFRALGTFTTARSIALALDPNRFEVTQGNVLTLSTAFDLAASSNAPLVKGGLGSLALTVAQAGWTGEITINAGAIRAAASGAVLVLGSTATGTTINNIGGLELAGGVTVSEPLTINTPGNNTTMAGSSFAGVLRSIIGATNTYSGAITVVGAPDADNTFRSVVFSADGGGALNLNSTSTITLPVSLPVLPGTSRVTNLILAGDGGGLLSGKVIKSGTGRLNLIKSGASTWTLALTSTVPADLPQMDEMEVRSGVLKVTSGNSSGGVLAAATDLTFTGSSTFQYDNSGAFAGKTQTLDALAFKEGDGVVQIQRSTAQSAFLTFTSFVREAGAVGVFQATGSSSTFTGSPNAKVTFTTGVPAGFIDPGVFVLQASPVATTGFGWYDTGNATVRPLNYTSDGATVGIATTAVQLANPNIKHAQIGASAAISAMPDISLYTLNLQSGSSIAFNAAATMTISNGGTGAGAILKTGTGSATISGGAGASLTTGSNTRELILRADVASDTMTISTSIVNTGALTKSGAGTVNLSGTNSWSGDTFVNGGNLVIQGASALPSGLAGLGLSGGTFTYQADGDGTSRRGEVIDTQKDVAVTGNATIAVAKRTASMQSLNKTVAFGDLSIDNQVLTITPSNGYGVRFDGVTNFNEALPVSFNVGGPGASNVVAGLTLAGVVSSSNGVGLIKLGTGTLVLENAANSFGSPGALIDIQNGTVAASSDGALGNLGNNVSLNVDSASLGFRATGTFATDRVFFLNKNSNQIEVTQGNILNLNTGLNLGGTATPNANALVKTGNGVLELAANSPATWTGMVSINAGALRLRTGGGLGGAGHAISIINPSAALQLSGTDQVYASYPLTLSTSGINNGGALENVSGDNLFTGPISLSGAGAVIGSSSGTLTLSGGISATGTQPLSLGGAGNINLITNPLAATIGTLTKLGTGTATIGVASTAYVGSLVVNAGTLAVSGAGTIGGTGTIALNPGSTLTINDSGTASANRLSNRAITITGGSLNLLGSATANTSESLTTGGAMFNRGLSVITVTAATGRQAVLNFNGNFNNVAQAQNSATAPTAASVLFRATNLGQPLVGTAGSGAGTTHPLLTNVAGITLTNSTNAILTFNGQTGAKDTSTKGILPWALVDSDVNGEGTSFATFDTTTNPVDGAGVTVPGLNPIRALRPAEQTTLITVANTNLSLSGAQSLDLTRNFNSITLRTGGGLTAGSLVQITLSSGGILGLAGNTGINGGVLNAAAGSSPLNIWTPGAATSLTITSTLTGGNGTAPGLIKAGAGTLILNGPQSLAIPGLSANSLNAQTVINQGTLQLVNGNNVLFPNTFLNIGPAGTLDLAGNSQYVQALFNDSAVAGGGGVVTSSTGTGTLVANFDNAARNWAGSIQGAVAFSRSGQNTATLYSDQSYTGITQINGGTTVLRDAAALSGTASVDINFATLNLDNAGGTQDLANRIKDTAPINLRGATLSLIGRPQTETAETLGALTLAPGLSTIAAITGSGNSTGIHSADLTFASLARQAGGTVNFTGTVNTTVSSLGLIGSTPRVLFTAAPTLTSDLIGGWAVVTNTTTPSATPEFASYVPTLGVGALGTGGFPQYSSISDLSVDGPTQNRRLTGTGSVAAGVTRTINSLNLAGGAASAGLTFGDDTSTLNLASGGLLHSGLSASIGSATLGSRGRLTAGTTAGTKELFIYNAANTLTINSTIVDNTAVGAVTALVLSGPSTITLAPQTNNTHTGGTTVNNGLTVNTTGTGGGVTVFPTGGLTINGATVTTTAAQQIAAGSGLLPNVVTLNGPATLNLVGDNTLNGLAFNNSGGVGTPVVNSGGALTLGSGVDNGGVTATSSNVTTTSTIAGRFILPTGSTTFEIDPIVFNGVQVAPTQATLALQGVGGSGGITKTGSGVLQFNAQSIFTGQVNVMDGGIQYGVGNGGSRFSNTNLAVAGTRININGQSGNIGSLSGVAGSLVTNSSPSGATLTVGFDGTSTTFAGRFARFGDGIPNTLNITKIGTGTLDLTGAGSDSTATFSMQGGTVRYSGAASSSFGANNVLTSATLTLDNATTNVNNRLGGVNANAITLNISGGTVNLIGNSAVDTTETIDVFTVGSGAGVLDLQPNANSRLTVVMSTTFNGIQVGGTLFIKNLPTLPDFDFDPSPTNKEQRIDLGLIALNTPGTQGSGGVETELAIRPDIVAAVDGGPATGFVTKDLFTNLLRPLATSATVIFSAPEVKDTLLSGAISPTNYDLSTVASISENTTANSLVLQGAAGINNNASPALGLYSPNATLLTQIVTTGGILAVEGATSAINVGLLSTAPNLPLTFHAYGDLDVNGSVGAGTGGLTKTGGGTLTINGRGYYTGVTTVNAGTLMLNGPQDHSIAIVPAATSGLTSALTMNGGLIDLNDRSQAFGTISSNNPNTGVGGEITNSGVSTVTLISSTNTTSTSSGAITGNLDFVKTGAGTLVLTSPSSYTGSTTIRGGGISLRDRGTLFVGPNGTSSIDIFYGALTIDQTQLNPLTDLNPTRIPASVPITMRGGTLTYNAGGMMDGTATFDNVTVDGGANIFVSGLTQGAGSTSVMNLGNLDRNPLDSSVVIFNQNGGTLANAGLNNPHIFLSTLNGGDVTLTNNIIGGWAIVGNSEFASVKGSGPYEIGAIGNTGAGFAGYNGTDISNVSTQDTWNINDTGATRTLAASKTINSLRVGLAATHTLGSVGTPVTLTLNSGGLLKVGDNAYTIAAGNAASELTSGPNANGQLFIFVNQNTTTIGVKITDGVDSPSGLNLIKSGGGNLVLTGANTYTGTTTVNQGTLTLNLTSPAATGAPGGVAIPGDLLINNATVTLSASNQLLNTAVVTIDGSGTLNMTGGNTISRVVFNNRGGNAAPGIQQSGVSNLTLSSGGVGTPTITSTNEVLSTTPVIAGTSLTLSNAQPVITTSGFAVTNLLITAPIHSAGTGNPILKNGSGSVAFNPAVGLSATTNPSSSVLSGLTSTAGLAVGMSVSGTNITAGTVISQILPGGTDILLSSPTGTGATATNTITFAGSTYTGGLTVSEGSLILASSSVLNPAVPLNPPIINGPVGVGTLTLANGASIMSDGTLRTLHNAVSVLGDFIFGPLDTSVATALAGNGVNLAGPMALSAGSHTISVNGPLNISTISGLITGSSGTLTKAGDGTLVLAKAGNDWGGPLAVTGGVLRNGIADAIPAGIDISVSNGAVFDTPGVNQVIKTLSGSGAVTNSSTTLAATVYVGGTSVGDTTTVADSTFDGSISGIVGDNNAVPPAALSLTKVGAGTFTLTGANTYRGTTDVNSGTLRVALSGSLKVASTFTVNAGATADILGSVTAEGSGSLQTSGLNARVRGSGIIGLNTTINEDGIIQPVISGSDVLTVSNGGFLDIKANATVLYQADTLGMDGNRIKVTGAISNIGLPQSGNWILKLEAGNVSIPQGLTFVIFDGDDGSFFGLLNGNTDTSDNVGNPVIDWGTTGWSLDPQMGGDAGVHFDFASNSIVLVGVVPEPGTGSLILGSLAMTLGLQRFRRRRTSAAA